MVLLSTKELASERLALWPRGPLCEAVHPDRRLNLILVQEGIAKLKSIDSPGGRFSHQEQVNRLKMVSRWGNVRIIGICNMLQNN